MQIFFLSYHDFLVGFIGVYLSSRYSEFRLPGLISHSNSICWDLASCSRDRIMLFKSFLFYIFGNTLWQALRDKLKVIFFS